MTLEELRRRARKAPPLGGPVGTLVIDSDDQVAAALEGARAYFDDDTSRRTIRLVIQGEEIGYLDRAAVARRRSLGFGDSAHAGLAGQPRFRAIRLRCPVGECPANPVFMMVYDEDSPPRCPAHAGETLLLDE